jgi:predicted alpha/beta superfamily hydrolase
MHPANSRGIPVSFLRKLGLASCLALGSQTAANAGGTALPIPVRIETLESAKVGETREFWVSLPDGYFDHEERFPVIYLMDGDFNFNSGNIGAVRQAAQLGEIPEFILVGIKNTNRSSDIFPEVVTYPDGSKDGGRADPYLDFIREELIPRIEKAYRTEEFRVLYGTSNTGFTAVYALFRNPSTANAYIAASATLSIPYFRKERDTLIRNFKGGRRRLSLVMGEHDFPTVISGNGALKEQIGLNAPAGLTCRLAVIRNGEHVPANSLIEGLRDLFDGWKITQRLTESSFPEIRDQVERRRSKYGVPGKLPEDALRDLGKTLQDNKQHDKALEVFQYRAQSYPRSADAQVSLGDAYGQAGKPEQARECYQQALLLAPGHAAATARLEGRGK